MRASTISPQAHSARAPCLRRHLVTAPHGRPRPLFRVAAAAAAASPPSPPSPPPKQPPSPPSVPLLHHLPLMGAHFIKGGNLESLLEGWAAEYGRYVEWRVPGSPRVLTVTDPDALREVCEVLQLAKSPRYADLLPLLGRSSMVLTEGAEWRAQRDAFNPGFSSNFLRGALPRFVACTKHLLEALDAAAAATEAAAAQQPGRNSGTTSSDSSGSAAGVVQVHHLAILLTLEVILSVGFGDETRFLHADGGVAGSGGGARPTHPLLASFVALGRHLAGVLDNPAISWVRHLPFFKAKTARLQAEYEGLLMEVLERRLQALGVDVGSRSGSSGSGGVGGAPASAAAATEAAEAGVCPMRGLMGGDQQQQQQHVESSGGSASSEAYDPTAGRAASPAANASGRTILELALEWSAAAAQQKGAGGAGGSNAAAAAAGSGLDVAALRDQLATFFAAGHDTTASLVAWAVYYLCRHPDAEARLVAEIDAALGAGDGSSGGSGSNDDDGDEGPTWKQLADMPYLTCVLKETLRLRPPVGILARWAPEGTVLRGFDAGGKVVLMSPYLQHTDAAAWGPNAKQWRPERWGESEADALPAHPYAYMPFSRGPRDCIGARFAMLEAKTILAMVYRRYSLTYAAEGEEGVLPGVTAHPARGVPVKVAWRRRRAGGPRAAADEVAEGQGAPREAAAAAAAL